MDGADVDRLFVLFHDQVDLFINIREGMDPLWTRRLTTCEEGVDRPALN